MSTPDSSRPTPDDRTELPPEPDPALRRQATRAIIVYGLLRLVLFVVLTVVIQFLAYMVSAPLPLVMSALLALIVAFPLSMIIFPKQRMAATNTLAQWKEQRAARKAWIKDELSRR